MSFVLYSLVKKKLIFAKSLAFSNINAYASSKAATLNMTYCSPSSMSRFLVSKTKEANFVLLHVCIEA